MSIIKTKSVAIAARTVSQLTLSQKEELADWIHTTQPHILLTILALSLDGVDMCMLEHALHVLMVIHMTIKNECANDLAKASLDDIRVAMERHQAMLSHLESVPDQKIWEQTAVAYPEPNLLAYVIGYLKENGITADTDAQCMVTSMSKVALDLYVDAYHNRPQAVSGERFG